MFVVQCFFLNGIGRFNTGAAFVSAVCGRPGTGEVQTGTIKDVTMGRFRCTLTFKKVYSRIPVPLSLEGGVSSK